MRIEVATNPGFPTVTFGITLGIADGDSLLEEGEGTLTIFVQGATAGEVVTFATSPDDVTYTSIGTANANANGDVGPLDLYIPGTGILGLASLRATSPTRGHDIIPIDLGGVVGSTGPGVDAAPVLIAGSAGRWVLQDLMPGGVGSWVMPINPTTMSNPHVSKATAVRSTTAPRTGSFSVNENSVNVVAWTLAGYCPDRTFHEHLNDYADLNRRIYVIDHRGRAWKCAVTSLAITPRKRHIETNGTPQDWSGDYQLVLDLLDQTFQSV